MGVGGWLGYMKIKPTQPQLGLGLAELGNYPKMSQKHSFGGPKWAIFGLKMSQECLKLFLSSPALKVDLVCQVLSILDIVKV